MVWAPANTFLFINPSLKGCISEMATIWSEWNISNSWEKQVMCDSVWKCMWVCQFTDYLYFSKRSARRMVSQIVTLSGLTRLKSSLRMECDALSLIRCMTIHVVDTVPQPNFQPPNLHTDISVTIFVGGFLRRPKGSGSERHPCNMAQLDAGSKAQ